MIDLSEEERQALDDLPPDDGATTVVSLLALLLISAAGLFGDAWFGRTGLWIGLAVCPFIVLGAIWLRRRLRIWMLRLRRRLGNGAPAFVLVFVVVAGGITLLVVGPHLPSRSLSPEEIVRRQEADTARRAAVQQRDAKLAEKSRRDSELCDIKSACSSFADARQECAVAGDFEHCLRIKMGDQYPRRHLCNSNGEYIRAPADMPTAAVCALHGLGL